MIVTWLLHFFCAVTQTTKQLEEDAEAAQHRTHGGDFLQWLPQKTGGHDYDKSLFHALCGLTPSLQFTKSISGIIDAGASVWVRRPWCMSLGLLVRSPSYFVNQFFMFVSSCMSFLSFYFPSWPLNVFVKERKRKVIIYFLLKKSYFFWQKEMGFVLKYHHFNEHNIVHSFFYTNNLVTWTHNLVLLADGPALRCSRLVILLHTCNALTETYEETILCDTLFISDWTWPWFGACSWDCLSKRVMAKEFSKQHRHFSCRSSVGCLIWP